MVSGPNSAQSSSYPCGKKWTLIPTSYKPQKSNAGEIGKIKTIKLLEDNIGEKISL